jgi:hypothetical protein
MVQASKRDYLVRRGALYISVRAELRACGGHGASKRVKGQ